MAIRAFQLFGDIELKGGDKTLTGLKHISVQVNTTEKHLANLRNELNKTGQAGSNFNKGFMSSFGIQGGGGFGSLVGSGVGNLLQTGVKALTGVVKDAAQQGIDYADMLQKAKIGFTNLLGDKEKGVAHVRELVQYGVDSAFETADVLKFAQSLEALKVKTSEVLPMLQGLGGWAAGAGNFDKMGNAVMAITQMLSKNKVSAEEMNQQLAEVTPDPYGMMMRGYQSAGYSFKDRAEFQAKAEGGDLNAQVAVRLMLAQAQKEKGSLLEEIVGGTISGRMAQLNDKKSVLYAMGMMGTNDLVADPTAGSAYSMKLQNINTLSGLYDPKKSPQALKIAKNLGSGASNIFKIEDFLESQTFAEDNLGDTVRSAATGDWKGAEASFKKMAQTLGGYIPQGLQDGITAGASAISSTATSVMGTSVWDSLESFWETKSPSKKTIRMGEWLIEGFEIGLSKKQRGNLERLTTLSKQSPDFLRKLGEGSARLGIDPADLLNVFAVESSFNPQAFNKFGYAGLMQIGSKEAAHMGTSSAAISKMSPEQQLPYIFKFLEERLKPLIDAGSEIGLAQLYATVGSGHATGNPNAIHMAKGGKRAAAYANNPLWDVNQDGVVRESEFGQAAMSALGVTGMSRGGPSVSASNPVPVQIVDFGNSVSFNSGPKSYGRFMSANDIPAGLLNPTGSTTARAGRTLNDPNAINAGNIYAGEQLLHTSGMMLNEKALMLTKPLELLTVNATAAANALDPFKAIDKEFGGGFVDEKLKKKKKDKLFDSALTKEGIAGDFQGGLASLFAGIGHDKPGNLLKNFGMGLLQDIQGRAAHDLSSMFTGILFGSRKGGEGADSNSLVGGLFSKLFGSIFGGHRASGGGVSAGRMYMFGEHGPELGIMGDSGHIFNNSQTRQMMGGGGPQRFIFVDDERAAEQHFNASDRNYLYKVRRNQRKMARINRYA